MATWLAYENVSEKCVNMYPPQNIQMTESLSHDISADVMQLLTQIAIPLYYIAGNIDCYIVL